ncbi:MAG: Crp/Fnr family transcriptional regulator [Lachnospiraceae bacterium]|nr:Crp/Fnr family transcriptional regulator [Lachnospiraceae bacterium]
MNENQLKNMEIFKNITEDEIKEMNAAGIFRERTYQKEEAIFHAGDTTREIGLLLSGSAHIENHDLWGNKTILSDIMPGQIFAEVYAFLGTEPMRVDVTAKEESQVVFLHVGHVLSDLERGENWKIKMHHNLLMLAARKNLVLSDRIFLTSSKSIRGRVLSYLSMMTIEKQSKEFDIPFNRQQLADYLSVNRSALSNELGKMQEEGLITFRHNHFVIRESDFQFVYGGN